MTEASALDQSEPPRMRGRPRAFDIDASLDRAIEVFSIRGYHGTSIADLSDVLGLTVGSLYKAFGDKRGILLAAFERYRALRSGRMRAAIAPAARGRDKVRAALLFYAEAAHGAAGERGCLVIAMTSELAASDPSAAAHIGQAHAANEQLFLDLILLGQADGSISARIEAQNVAGTLLCTALGMRVIGKTGRSRAQMMMVVEMAMTILD